MEAAAAAQAAAAAATREDIHCPIPNCTYSTGPKAPEVAAALLNTHATVHQTGTGHRRGPKADRPPLSDNLEEVGWNAFLQDWETFVRANDVAPGDQAVQLFLCCNASLKSKILSICPDVHTKTKDQLLVMLKSLAVIPIAASVRIHELLQMFQNSGESVRSFHSRVKGKALTCRFEVTCNHPHVTAGTAQVDYTEKMIRHVLLNGLYDNDIHLNDLDNLSNNEIVARVESKETAREATSSHSNNAITEYKRQQRAPPRPPNPPKGNVVGGGTHQLEKLEGECASCKTKIKLFKKHRSGKLNKTPFTHCYECHKKINPPDSRTNDSKDANAISFSISSVHETPEHPPNEFPLPYFPVRGISQSIPSAKKDPRVFECGSWVEIPDIQCDLTHRIIRSTPTLQTGEWVELAEHTIGAIDTLSETFLSHHVLENGMWVRKSAPPHPTLSVFAGTLKADYEHFGFSHPDAMNIPLHAITDSGAQCCVWSWAQCRDAGFKREDLIPVRQKLNAVSKDSIRIIGAVILRLSSSPNGTKETQCGAIVYVSPDVTGFYMSNDTMKTLKIVPPDFPSIDSAINIQAVDTSHCGE